MLLAIDVGNTNTVFALFDGDQQIAAWRAMTLPQRTGDEYAALLAAWRTGKGLASVAITDAVIGSVVPEATFHLTRLCATLFEGEPLIVGAPGVILPLTIKVDNPDEVGADRVVNALAALADHRPPLLILDFGTATTLDVLDAAGAYCGGVIAPGIALSLEVLHRAAAKLPRVEIAKPARVIGTSTTSAMRSGVFWGYVGLIEGLIARVSAEMHATPLVIATGGLAPLFAGDIPAIRHLDPDLTLRGLQKAHAHNRTRQ